MNIMNLRFYSVAFLSFTGISYVLFRLLKIIDDYSPEEPLSIIVTHPAQSSIAAMTVLAGALLLFFVTPKTAKDVYD